MSKVANKPHNIGPEPMQGNVRLKRSRQTIGGKSDGDNVSTILSRTSHHVSRTHAPPPQENTYRLTPEETFNTCEVERLTEAVLVERLQDVEYDPSSCKDLSQEMAARIMDRVKTLKLKRFKLVAVVSIGSVNERPGMQFGSRCLWNESTDNFTSVKFTNGSIFAVAMVYGLYFE